ncbi:hypothetical protein [Akkermansia sp.]|uniref:hypothetical protein n=1 Tax=Akkermansia sp. TaxID=1872421 RepID=UPI0025C4F0D9|nr:hypothetical protein [Akkermansia sp.]MCD8272655.1 hypothetical protein [Akkermansia sp.]
MYTLSFSHSFTGVPCIHTSGKPSRASDGRASSEATVLFPFFSEEAASNGIPAAAAKITEHPKTNGEKFNMVTRYYRNLPRQANRKKKGKIEKLLPYSFHQNKSQNAPPPKKEINHEIFHVEEENKHVQHPHFLSFIGFRKNDLPFWIYKDNIIF